MSITEEQCVSKTETKMIHEETFIEPELQSSLAMSIDAEDKRLPMELLRPKTKQVLSLLNGRKLIPSSAGVLRDWRGLMDLCRIGGQYASKFRIAQDPTEDILQLWTQEFDKRATIGNFIAILEQMDRYDVIEEMTVLLMDDIQLYKSKAPNHSIVATDAFISEETYDAFVLFDYADIDFATKLIGTLERYQMKVCVKKDQVGHDIIIKQITERCNKLILIISDTLFGSFVNRFYVNFALAYGIENPRKLIPCLYKECKNVPPELRYYYCLDYRKAKTWDFWSRLQRCLTNDELRESS